MKIALVHKITLLLLLQLFWVCPALGQIQKTALKPEEYAKWSKVINIDQSTDGTYVAFQLLYERITDTLFVKTVTNRLVLSVPKGHSGSFLSSNYYGCFTENNSYQITDLKTGVMKQFSNITAVQFLKRGEQLLLQTLTANNQSTLQFINYDGTLLEEIKNITHFKVSPNRSALLYCQQLDSGYTLKKVAVLKNELSVTEINRGLYPFANFAWQSNSTALAYIEDFEDSNKFKIQLYSKAFRNSKEIDLSKDLPFNAESLQVLKIQNLTISDDGARIFFSVIFNNPGKIKDDPNVVEVWNSMDKQLYFYRQKFVKQTLSKLACWELQSNRFILIEKTGEKLYQLNGNQTYAVTANHSNYLPTSHYSPEVDYKTISLKTGEEFMFLKKQPAVTKELYFSPDGSKVVYVKDGAFWYYVFENHKHFLVPQLSSVFLTHDTYNEDLFPHGIAGWSADGNMLYLYDAYDLWQYSFSDSKLVRLTDGGSKEIAYRIIKNRSNGSISKEYYMQTPKIMNLDQPLLLSMNWENERKNGFAVLNKGKLKTLIFEEKKLSQPYFNFGAGKISYLREDFNLPPQLMMTDFRGGLSAMIFQSNTHHFNYSWGRSELVHYQNSKGNSLRGVLYYPFNYNKEKKYPLVVHVYEKLSDRFHEYIFPTVYNSAGFNTANLTGNGYFVLQPDIVYEVGNPGFSALDCIESAVLAVLQKGSVDALKVGLIGHSFGGYETLFVTSHSKLFATGVAGAGLTDMQAMYLNLGVATARPEAWRFEDFQLRMRAPLFDNQQAYIKNSPITYAKDCSIPLLTWTGAEDDNVPPDQSMWWYMAMRRLEKNHIMLRYPAESHVMSNAIQQRDLTIKIQQWFDYYLKGKNPQPWMSAE